MAARFLFHLKVKFEGRTTLVVPLVVVLQPEDKLALLAAGDAVLADLSDILSKHRDRILPCVSLEGSPIPGLEAADIPVHHGKLVSVRFSVCDGDRYSVLTFPERSDSLFTTSLASFTVHAMVAHKEAAAARRQRKLLQQQQ